MYLGNECSIVWKSTEMHLSLLQTKVGLHVMEWVNRSCSAHTPSSCTVPLLTLCQRSQRAHAAPSPSKGLGKSTFCCISELQQLRLVLKSIRTGAWERKIPNSQPWEWIRKKTSPDNSKLVLDCLSYWRNCSLTLSNQDVLPGLLFFWYLFSHSIFAKAL